MFVWSSVGRVDRTAREVTVGSFTSVQWIPDSRINSNIAQFKPSQDSLGPGKDRSGLVKTGQYRSG